MILPHAWSRFTSVPDSQYITIHTRLESTFDSGSHLNPSQIVYSFSLNSVISSPTWAQFTPDPNSQTISVHTWFTLDSESHLILIQTRLYSLLILIQIWFELTLDLGSHLILFHTWAKFILNLKSHLILNHSWPLLTLDPDSHLILVLTWLHLIQIHVWSSCTWSQFAPETCLHLILIHNSHTW